MLVMAPSTDHSRRVATIVSQRFIDAGLSVRQVAEQVGIPPSTLARRVAGHSPFDLDELTAVATLLGTTAIELLEAADVSVPVAS